MPIKDERSDLFICPTCRRGKLIHFPNDDIRHYECDNCGWMITEGYLRKLTKSKEDQLYADRWASIDFRRIQNEQYFEETEKRIEDAKKAKENKSTENLVSLQQFTE